MGKKIGFVGWRGMVGQVLADRIIAGAMPGGAARFYLLTTSQKGGPTPLPWAENPSLMDAYDLDVLREMDVVVTCRGSAYTRDVHPRLRGTGWGGYWLDASSALRMESSSTIVLDPVNLPVIERALDAGGRDFIGGNCTVSIMLMALGGLFREGLVEWLSFATYQAASGAGAAHMRELLVQMGQIGEAVEPALAGQADSILAVDRIVSETLRGGRFETSRFGTACAGNLIAWIDEAMPDGRTREEWKGQVETAKILDLARPVPIDGTCVRVGSMRSHCQSSTVKLSRDVSLGGIEALIQGANEWVEVVANDGEQSVARLHPAATSGTSTVLVGRLRKMAMGSRYLNAFSCGDQLIWGAAEPLLRMLGMLL